MNQDELSLNDIIKELDALAGANQASIGGMIIGTRGLADRLRQQRERVRQPQASPTLPGRKTYDDWLSDLFFQVENARPREELFRVFCERFNDVWAADDDVEGRRGPCLMILEALAEENHFVFRGLRQAGLHERDWIEFQKSVLTTSNEALLKRVLIEQQPVEMWYLDFLSPEQYGGLFDTLLPGGRQRHLWVQALPLVERGEYRGVFFIYPSRGDRVTPKPPGNAAYDWRMARFLAIAYRHLERQIKNLAAYVEASRRDMINLLAPGLMHHEVGFVADNIANMTERLAQGLARIEAEYDLPDLKIQLQRGQDIVNLGRRLRDVTHAFNRLDRRGVAERSTLAVPVGECRHLLDYRLDKAKLAFIQADSPDWSVALQTDITLVSHALLNICNNAINAIEEEAGRQEGDARAIRLAPVAHLPEPWVGLDICNNGPAIPVDAQPHIFKRGYTTRPDGHGQGLFLVHLIAQYLGGELRLLSEAELPVGYQVGFRLTLLKQHDAEREIGNELNAI